MTGGREPLSWLILERYALGELSAEERVDVEARLADSETDRACLAEILQDESELPLLDQTRAEPAPVSLDRARAGRQAGRWLALSAGLCAAAALLLVVVRDERAGSVPSEGAAYDGVKGADVALRLVSERQGVEPKSFAVGERFKLEVTCPARLSAALQVLVFQAGEVFQPLPASPAFSCGNLVSWPGAFALDGSDAADVCLYWGAEAAPRTRAELGQEAVCTHLEAR